MNMMKVSIDQKTDKVSKGLSPAKLFNSWIEV
jgi:hypothetical protein